MSPLSEKVQQSVAEWVMKNGPWFFAFLLLAGVMVWEADQDRVQDTRMIEHLREMEAQRLASISEALARVAETCEKR